MAARKGKSKKTEEAEVLEEIQDQPVEETQESKEDDKRPESRVIVGFGSIKSIRKYLLDGSGDEQAAIEKMANKCVNDFALKCACILETCAEAPSSVYTYVMFNERFGWLQQEDITTKEGTKMMVLSNEQDFIPTKIREAYLLKNKWVTNAADALKEEGEDFIWSSYFIYDLLKGTKEQGLKVVRNMFGANLFPKIVIWYNFNEDTNEWQYAYSIIADMKGEGQDGNEK